MNLEKISEFINYASNLVGNEKSEAQVFLDRLFIAFGHKGYREAGATLETRVKAKGESTKFADLVWKPRVLIEMKSKGEKLDRHYRQAFDYWCRLVPDRPRYVLLCNFEEFWIYDFNLQVDEPLDRVRITELDKYAEVFGFLLPDEKKPRFGRNRIQVTREAADHVASLFNSFIKRGIPRTQAQRFILQCVVAIFSEDVGLLPAGIFSDIIDDCFKDGSTYDLIGGLFRQMNDPVRASGGRFREVQYFNGGLYSRCEPIELDVRELGLIRKAANEDWSFVNPGIFGTLFQDSMDKNERHAFGAHFTTEEDILKVVSPSIVRPWLSKIENASTLSELKGLRSELTKFRVLDPACGSGNFLYVAFREIKRLEFDLIEKIRIKSKSKTTDAVQEGRVSIKQFFGIDIIPFATELTKVTMILAKELAIKEMTASFDIKQGTLNIDEALPLENLDNNIIQADAVLVDEWPSCDVVIGNPPYLGSRYLAKEHGYDYVNQIYNKYPGVSKMADFCSFWFRRAHDVLPNGGRAGLVATNTIRQNESREATLDYIIDNGGTITEAVGTQVWTGDAAVHVSIVNWLKGEEKGLKKLFNQIGDSTDDDWTVVELPVINSALSNSIDVSDAKELSVNQEPKMCFQGQNPVNEGFFLEPIEAHDLLSRFPNHNEVIFPYMIGRDLLEKSKPGRYIIDFAQREMTDALKYKKAFEIAKARVMPSVLEKAEEEKLKTGKESTRWTRMAKRWWQFRDYQPGTMKAISSIPRYISCSRVTKRPIFEFVSSVVHPDTALMVFPFCDDYSFGILQSSFHTSWFTARCSTLKGDARYTSETIFDTFPWPQSVNKKVVLAVAKAAQELREVRRSTGVSLREMYRSLEIPGSNRLRDAHLSLDAAVREAYGAKNETDLVKFILALNTDCFTKLQRGEKVIGPGLPVEFKGEKSVYTADCVVAE